MVSAVLSFFTLPMFFLVFSAFARDVYIGSGVYLPDTNLGSDIYPLRDLFDGNISAYIYQDPTFDTVFTEDEFSHSTENVLKKFGVTFGLNFPVDVLQLSFQTSFNSISGSDSEVTAYSKGVESYSRRDILIEKEVEEVPLSPHFIQDLLNLPEPPAGDQASQWGQYIAFLNKWGSHYVNGVYYGSWLRQWSVASFSSKYTQRELGAKACLSLTEAKVIPSLEACAGYNTAELNAASKLTTTDTLEIRGGNGSTVSGLSIKRTEELVAKFIEEGRTSTQVVKYNFVPVWRLVIDRYGTDTKEWRVATALEGYYNGYLAFKCPYDQLNRPYTVMQKFRRVSSTGKYQCARQCYGCRLDKDCHQHIFQCYCYGKSCIVAFPSVGRAQIQLYKDDCPRNVGPNRSCSGRGFGCSCNTVSKERNCGPDNMMVIWDQNSQSITSNSSLPLDDATNAEVSSLLAKEDEEIVLFGDAQDNACPFDSFM